MIQQGLTPQQYLTDREARIQKHMKEAELKGPKWTKPKNVKRCECGAEEIPANYEYCDLCRKQGARKKAYQAECRARMKEA